jgi:hypothetical protein
VKVFREYTPISDERSHQTHTVVGVGHRSSRISGEHGFDERQNLHPVRKSGVYGSHVRTCRAVRS